MPKVSVIVPIYGVEKYIERCARSLFEQTLDDIEFIFVDDCTPDRSIEILESVIEKYRLRFAEKKYDVRIVRMPTNSGQAAVRRHGMQLATGDYVIHCDSDDWVDVTMYEKMYIFAVSGNFDMVWCDFYQSNGLKQIRKQQPSKLDRDSIIRSLLCSKLMASVCNRLYKRQLQNSPNFIYPTDNMTEDFVITLQLVINSKSNGYIAAPLYYYYYNNKSLSHNPSIHNIEKKIQGAINNNELILRILKEHKLSHEFQREIDCKCFKIRELIIPLLHIKKYRFLWNNTYPYLNKRLWYNPYIDFRSKIRSLCLLLGLYRMYVLLISVYRCLKLDSKYEKQ